MAWWLGNHEPHIGRFNVLSLQWTKAAELKPVETGWADRGRLSHAINGVAMSRFAGIFETACAKCQHTYEFEESSELLPFNKKSLPFPAGFKIDSEVGP
jgi:hypothetical protein